MRKLLRLLPVVLFFYSCTAPSTNIPVGLLSTDSLPIQNFTIDINTDTLLHTSNGTWLKIDKGTFSSGNGKVALEIKEALSMQQIIRAGLVTASNGQPLASGGMIYINAAAGQKVTINKPFKVAVPAASLDKSMQLFKGEKTTDGNMNWKDPKAVDDNIQMNAIKKGEILFQQKCASCHGVGKEGSGPDLANVVKRLRPFEGEGGGYLIRHEFLKQLEYGSSGTTTRNADGKIIRIERKIFYHSDPYVCNLITLFQNKEIDLSEDFSKNVKNWDLIYRYIQNESDKRNLPYPRHAYLDSCIDSCDMYQRLKEDLEVKRVQEEIKKIQLIKDNGSLVERRADPTWGIADNPPPPDFDEKAEPNQYDAVYYQFTIETFGWFNIDMLIEGKEGVANSELFVRVVGTYTKKIKIYLIIPSAKILGEGGPSEKDDELYAFFYKSGNIPLPQNTRAYILAVTETENALAYGLKEFTTQTKQQLEISLTTATKQAFDKAMEGIGGDKLAITTKEAKNAAMIKEADKRIKELEGALKNAEKLKPTRCDCDCGEPMPRPETAEAKSARK